MGERWRVGSAVLEVTGPRIPCGTFAAWMGERHWVRRFTERGRTGAYLAVVEPGTVRDGDEVEVVERPEHGITVLRVFAALTGDLEAAREVLAARVLGDEEHDDLAVRVARRARGGPAAQRPSPDGSGAPTRSTADPRTGDTVSGMRMPEGRHR